MIYTCYEMVRDCRADKPEGWCYFISHYVPAVRKLLAHYDLPGARLEDVLKPLRDPRSSLFQPAEPAPERWFVAELCQKVLAGWVPKNPAVVLDLDIVAAALEQLTLIEKQVAWLDTMAYSAAETGIMMRMAPATVEKIRGKASELIRAKQDSWSAGILRENGLALGRAAASAGGSDCRPPRDFLDVLDGRTTWPEREQMSRHVDGCWHCIDHFCRMVEVVHLLRGLTPLTDSEAEPYRQLFGVQPVKQRSLLERLMGGRVSGRA